IEIPLKIEEILLAQPDSLGEALSLVADKEVKMESLVTAFSGKVNVQGDVYLLTIVLPLPFFDEHIEGFCLAPSENGNHWRPQALSFQQEMRANDPMLSHAPLRRFEVFWGHFDNQKAEIIVPYKANEKMGELTIILPKSPLKPGELIRLSYHW